MPSGERYAHPVRVRIPASIGGTSEAARHNQDLGIVAEREGFEP
jgi:hypothetical protein